MAVIKTATKRYGGGKGGARGNFGGHRPGGGMMIWVPAGSSMPFVGGKGKGKGGARFSMDKTKEKLSKFEPSQKVWVGGLSKTTTWKKLETHFKDVASVKPAVVDISDKKRTATVCFKSVDDVASAVAMLNGSELDGSTIEVDTWEKPPKAEGEEEKPKRKKQPKRFGFANVKKPVSKVGTKLKTVDPNLKVWIGGLSDKTTFKEISKHFEEKYAKPKLVDILPKGKAVVTYESTDDVASAVAMVNGTELNGKTLEVDVWVKPEKPEKK